MLSGQESFRLEIFSPEKAGVYLSCAKLTKFASLLIHRLDELGIRVVGDVDGLPRDIGRVRRIMGECSGVVSLLTFRNEVESTGSFLLEELQAAANLRLPLVLFVEQGVNLQVTQNDRSVTLRFGNSEEFEIGSTLFYGPLRFKEASDSTPEQLLNSFLERVMRPSDRTRPYAFYIGRLERDFSQAREAMRTAVENEAGIPFLWADDGRHRTNVESVRERTRLLLKHARFVIADLTLGVESPQHENPSRAHEIGLSIAYDRKVLLLSQEPRRYPYFSISDMQVVFWATEVDLESKVKQWLQNHRDCFGRVTWNHRLPETGYEPRLPPVKFSFNAKDRYIGPRTPGQLRPAHKAVIMCVAAIAFCCLITAMLVFGAAAR